MVITAPLPVAIRRAALALLFYLPAADAALAQVLDLPQEITFDLDGDGRPDRALLVPGAADDGTIDLKIHLGASRRSEPDFVKAAISDEEILTFESREKGTLSLTTCTGCGANRSTEETLTVVFRNGALVVGGYERLWDWNTRRSDGTVETVIGGCRIDFLTGQGFVDAGIDDMKPVARHFTPIALAEWSHEKRPAICKFVEEE